MTLQEVKSSLSGGFLGFAVMSVLFGLPQTFGGRFLQLSAFVVGWLFMDWVFIYLRRE